MKKVFAILMAVCMLAACMGIPVSAAPEDNVYDLFVSLLHGHSTCLTVTAEDVTGMEEMPLPCTQMVWTAVQKDDQLVLEILCDGISAAKATMTAQDVTLETALEALPSITCTWETLAPKITVSREGDISLVKVSMTGPEQELINFSMKVKGTGADSYAASFQSGLITGPGVIYGIYDDFGAENGVSERSFSYTWDVSMFSIEAEGEETCDITKDGTMTITRVDECTVLLDDDEIGTLTLRSVWTFE